MPMRAITPTDAMRHRRGLPIGQASRKWLLSSMAAALLLIARDGGVFAQDCTTFQKAVTDALAASDALDAQMKRFRQTSDTPKYDVDVCLAATKLRDQAHTAAGYATAACDPGHIAANMGSFQESAEFGNSTVLHPGNPDAAAKQHVKRLYFSRLRSPSADCGRDRQVVGDRTTGCPQ
jgi:hypothetical protein